MRVRGLKREIRAICWQKNKSHPMRVRGLKLKSVTIIPLYLTVAPHAGAWIETSL